MCCGWLILAIILLVLGFLWFYQTSGEDLSLFENNVFQEEKELFQ